MPTASGLVPRYAGSDWDLLRIPASGGKAERVGLSDRFYRFPSAHPDGKRIAFDTSSSGELGTDLWVLENFLPKEPTTD
jgi:Tol biopolymer transport system component